MFVRKTLDRQMYVRYNVLKRMFPSRV